MVDYERDTERHLASEMERMSRLVDRDDVMVKHADRGLYFTPTNKFKVRDTSTGRRIKSGSFRFHTRTENVYNIIYSSLGLPKTLIKMLFMPTLHYSDCRESFPKLSDCLISQIRQT